MNALVSYTSQEQKNDKLNQFTRLVLPNSWISGQYSVFRDNKWRLFIVVFQGEDEFTQFLPNAITLFWVSGYQQVIKRRYNESSWAYFLTAPMMTKLLSQWFIGVLSSWVHEQIAISDAEFFRDSTSRITKRILTGTYAQKLKTTESRRYNTYKMINKIIGLFAFELHTLSEQWTRTLIREIIELLWYISEIPAIDIDDLKGYLEVHILPLFQPHTAEYSMLIDKIPDLYAWSESKRIWGIIELIRLYEVFEKLVEKVLDQYPDLI